MNLRCFKSVKLFSQMVLQNGDLIRLYIYIRSNYTFTLDASHGTYKSPIWKGNFSLKPPGNDVSAVNLQGCAHGYPPEV